MAKLGGAGSLVAGECNRGFVSRFTTTVLSRDVPPITAINHYTFYIMLYTLTYADLC